MVSFRIDDPQPRWGFKGKPYDIVVFTTQPGPRQPAATLHTEQIRRAVADFLVRWLADAPRSEEESTASFLYVLLSRSPRPDEMVLGIRDAGPLVEFGFGEAPAAPEEWEIILLSDLIHEAVKWLRGEG